LPCVTSLLELVCHGRPDRVQYTISINKQYSYSGSAVHGSTVGRT
jgi:hypothetical protein